MSQTENQWETWALNGTLDQMGLINIYRAFHPKAAEHTVFSNAHGTFSRIDHMLGYKTSLGKFKKTEILSAKKHASISTKASFQTTTLEINYKKKNCKKHKHVETKQYATKQPMDHWRNQIEFRKHLKTNENVHTMIQTQWDAAKVILRGKSIMIQAYLRKQEISQINNLNLHLKQLEKEQQTKTKVNRMKEIITIRAEINEIET